MRRPSRRISRWPTAFPAAGASFFPIVGCTSSTASMILRYPVHRQRTPPNASITSLSDGFAFFSRSAVAETSIPGVQAPHCAAPCRRNASCKRSKMGGREGKPSIVVMALPSTWPKATRHEQTGTPSIRTVQAPQSPASQPTFVPVKPSCSRRTRESRCVGGALTETARSFTRSVCSCFVSEVGAKVAIYANLTQASMARRTSCNAASWR